MPHAAKTAAASDVKPSAPDEPAAAAAMMRTMLLARDCDERLIRLYKQGQIHGGVYCGIGQEALGAASAAASAPQDLFAPLIRNMSVHIGRGETPLSVFRQWLGRAEGPTRGRDGNIHYGTMANGVYAMISHLGAMISVVAGGVMARRRKGVDAVGFASIGDGGTSTGDFHEATNFAAVFQIPLIILIENNKFAYSTPAERQYRCKRLIDRAPGYGVEGFTVDGNDALALYRLLRDITADIRARPRTVLVECDTMRMRGHGEHDDFSYAPPDLKKYYTDHDPLRVAEESFPRAGLMTGKDIAALRTASRREVDHAYRAAMDEPPPNPDTLMSGVYADA